MIFSGCNSAKENRSGGGKRSQKQLEYLIVLPLHTVNLPVEWPFSRSDADRIAEVMPKAGFRECSAPADMEEKGHKWYQITGECFFRSAGNDKAPYAFVFTEENKVVCTVEFFRFPNRDDAVLAFGVFQKEHEALNNYAVLLAAHGKGKEAEKIFRELIICGHPAAAYNMGLLAGRVSGGDAGEENFILASRLLDAGCGGDIENAVVTFRLKMKDMVSETATK